MLVLAVEAVFFATINAYSRISGSLMYSTTPSPCLRCAPTSIYDQPILCAQPGQGRYRIVLARVDLGQRFDARCSRSEIENGYLVLHTMAARSSSTAHDEESRSTAGESCGVEGIRSYYCQSDVDSEIFWVRGALFAFDSVGRDIG
jgi:hypothetical protein